MDIEYGRADAIEYARRWAYGRNPKYYDFSALGGDCTNFVSQCLVAGGMPMNYSNPNGWYYGGVNSRSASFSGVQFLYNFLTDGKKRRGPAARETVLSALLPADIIQLSFDGVNFSHSLFIMQTGGGGPYVATHTFDSFGKSLYAYSYAAARGLHILGGYK